MRAMSTTTPLSRGPTSSNELAELQRRVGEARGRLDEEVIAGRRSTRSLLVILDIIREQAVVDRPAKPYPTSAGAWRRR
jgi:hypothetical protein